MREELCRSKQGKLNNPEAELVGQIKGYERNYKNEVPAQEKSIYVQNKLEKPKGKTKKWENKTHSITIVVSNYKYHIR